MKENNHKTQQNTCELLAPAGSLAICKAVVAAGADALVVHARKAWLQGLSPKENRDVPPLDYDLVYALKRDYPHVPIGINGGIHALDEAKTHLELLDGVMMGRAAYQNPGLLLEVDAALFGEPAPFDNMFDAIEAYEPYIASQLAAGERLHDMVRHILGCFAGQPGARQWRRHLSTEAPKRGAGIEVLREALAHLKREAARLAAE